MQRIPQVENISKIDIATPMQYPQLCPVAHVPEASQLFDSECDVVIKCGIDNVEILTVM